MKKKSTTLMQAERRLRHATLQPVRIALARRARRRHQGVFIGVTGSSAKSTTSALLGHLLAELGPVTAQVASNTIGPLIRTMRHMPPDARHIVAELGVGRPGQMAPMAALYQPDIAVVTMIRREHRSAFRKLEAIADEKGTVARVLTFGWDAGADCRIVAATSTLPERLHLQLSWRGQDIFLQTRLIGRHFAIPVAAAATVALARGLSADALRAALARFEPLVNRMRLTQIPKGPDFLIDTIKAPYHSLELAYDVLDEAKAPYRRIVLGAISDTGLGTYKTYRQAVARGLAIADEVIAIGPDGGREWADPAESQSGRYRRFPTTRAAADHIRTTARPGELILLKGSSNYHLERISLQYEADIRCWETACGRGEACITCGLFAQDFEKHRRIRRKRRFLRLFARKAARV
ncbi:MAG: Mur ligase family protein [Paracoccaceae bacterium]